MENECVRLRSGKAVSYRLLVRIILKIEYFVSATFVTATGMAYTSNYIKDKLTKNLAASYVNVVDQSDGCGAKFDVIIVSDMFEGKPLLQRHRLVNSVLEDELKLIHAFSQRTYTKEQWEKLNAEN